MEKGCKTGVGHAERGVWKSAEGNVGDKTTFLSDNFDYGRRTIPSSCASSFLISLSPGALPPLRPPVRFVLHLGAYRTESLCIPMTTGWMHSKCKRMRDNAQVNVSRERDFAVNVCASSPDGFRNCARLVRKQNNLSAINNLGKQIGIIILDGIMPEDGEISATCVLCNQLEQNNTTQTLIVAVAVYYSLNSVLNHQAIYILRDWNIIMSY